MDIRAGQTSRILDSASYIANTEKIFKDSKPAENKIILLFSTLQLETFKLAIEMASSQIYYFCISQMNFSV